MKRLLLAGGLIAALLTASPTARAHEYDKDDSGYPLRVVGYVVHAMGTALEYGVARPIHYVVSQPNLDILFGHEVTESPDYDYFEWAHPTVDRPRANEVFEVAFATKSEPEPAGDVLAVPDSQPAERPIEVTPARELFTIYFDFDRSTLRPDQFERLDHNLDVLKDRSDSRIQVIGHTDERGTTEYNYNLGLKRAQSVQSYLVDNGISADRVMVQSRGEEMPAATGSTEDAYAQNRRAEFREVILLETSTMP